MRYGRYWWQLGYGASNPKWMNGEASVCDVCGKLYVEVPTYSDLFRVSNYPKRVITSRRDLRRWMGKRYFDLEEWQLEKISQFFKENFGGIIIFG